MICAAETWPNSSAKLASTGWPPHSGETFWDSTAKSQSTSVNPTSLCATNRLLGLSGDADLLSCCHPGFAALLHTALISVINILQFPRPTLLLSLIIRHSHYYPDELGQSYWYLDIWWYSQNTYRGKQNFSWFGRVGSLFILTRSLT